MTVIRCVRGAAPLVVAVALVASAFSSGPAADAIAKANRLPRDSGVPAIGPNPDLVPLRTGGTLPSPQPWHDAAVSEDGRTLFVRFVHVACRWLDTAAATESGDRVDVRIVIAHDPAYDNPADGPLETCLGTPRLAVTRVELRAPLRGRTVYDVYAGQPRPVEPAG